MTYFESISPPFENAADTRTIVQLPCGMFVFTEQYLFSESIALNQLSPELVVCEHSGGVLKDFGHGIYGFIPTDGFTGEIHLRCMVEGVVIGVDCHLIHRVHRHVPEQFSRINSQKPTFSYSILSDHSVFISKRQFADALGVPVSVSDHLRIMTVSSPSLGYTVKQTAQYCVVMQDYADRGITPRRCILDVSLFNVAQKTLIQQRLVVDVTLFSTVIPQRLLFPSSASRCTFEQRQLLENTDQLASPILFVEALYSLVQGAIFEPQPSGAFEINYANLVGKVPDLLLYNISDAVDMVGVGVAIPGENDSNIARLSHTMKKWCAIEINKSDLRSAIATPNVDGDTVNLDYSDRLAVQKSCTDIFRLTIPNNGTGREKISVRPSYSCESDALLSFELIFMPNLVYQNCVKRQEENHWQVCRREIEQLVSQRTSKKIRDVDLSCHQALITANSTDFCSVWTSESADQISLNLTVSFDDGSIGFSSITI